MLNKIIHFSIRNKLIIGVMTGANYLGPVGATKLPLDACPMLQTTSAGDYPCQRWLRRK
jgi:Cu/Ag efflux pump CusA